jgi:hypothetical protein
MSKARGLADLGNAYSDGALSNRNLIINGAMQVWQRGTSGTVNYVADRFITASTTSVSKVSSSLTGFGSAMRIVANSSDPYFVQYIENTDGYLAGQTMTLSFWMKSDIADPFDAGQYCQYNDGSEVGQLLVLDVPSVIETNGDWKRYSRTFTLPTTATGHKFNARIDFNETTGQTLDITGVQLELGDTATPFEHRSYGQELALCQRYYYVSGDIDCGQSGAAVSGGYSTYFAHSWTLPVTMRTAPTVLQNVNVVTNSNGIQTASATPTTYNYNHGNMTGNYSYWEGSFILEAEL